jgi:hypothetical protein
MADQVRGEILRALTAPARLEGNRADALLDANPAERALAIRVLLEQAAEALADAGAIRPGRTVWDLTLREAQSIVAGLGVLLKWWPQPGLAQHRAGDVAKVIPTDQAAFAAALLQFGGWLPPPAEPDQDGPG